MDAYRALVNHEYEEISNFDQLATYHGRMLCAQYLTNVQENFVRKVKAYCTVMIVKRLQDQVPPGLTRYFLKHILTIISRAAHIRLLQARNRRVQGFCLSPPTLNHLASANLDAYDLSVTLILLNIVPNGVPHQGVQYYVVVRPQVYSQAYLELADLYEVKGLKLFNAVPISTSLIPRHICIDTRLLYINILRGPFARMDIIGQKLVY